MDLDQLRRKADLLGVAWTYCMDDNQLKQAITSAEERSEKEKTMVGQEADVNVPKCFGLFWAGIPGPEGEECRNCAVGDRCLDQFVKVTLPEAEGSKGEQADPIEVSDELKLGCPDAVVAARKYRASKYPVPVEIVEDQPVIEVESKEELIEEPIEAPVKKVLSKKKKPPKKVAPKKKKKKAAKKKKPTPEVATESTPEVAIESTAEVATESTAEDKPKVKKRPLKAVSSVKSAEDAAKPLKKKSAPSAWARVERATVPWGKQTYLRRWTKEREREPLIRAVKVGQILKVEWPKKSGQIHMAKCCKGLWKVTPHGKPTVEAPTLYRSGVAVSGQPNKWSAVRFWKLK